MPAPRCQRWFKTLLLLGSCAAGLAAMAAERMPGASGPPRTYRLDEVTVRVQRLYGHGQPMGQLMLAGKGSASLQSGDRKRLFEHAAKDHLNVLNGLYRIRFFDLPAQVRAPLLAPQPRQVLHEPGARQCHVYFPASGEVSLQMATSDGRSSELAVMTESCTCARPRGPSPGIKRSAASSGSTPTPAAPIAC